MKISLLLIFICLQYLRTLQTNDFEWYVSYWCFNRWNNLFVLPNANTCIIFRRILVSLYHDDVIKWKHFPRNWPFVRGIHWSPVNSPHNGQWRGALMLFYLRLNKRLSKQSWGWWFETLSLQSWRHSNVIEFFMSRVWKTRQFVTWTCPGTQVHACRQARSPALHLIIKYIFFLRYPLQGPFLLT